MTDAEGLTLRDAVSWCGPGLSFRDATRLDESALRRAFAGEGVLASVTVTESAWVWWTGAISGRGHRHDRAWTGVMIAHRFGFALALGVDALVGVPVLGHWCDKRQCQRVPPGHVVASSYLENRRDWAARRAMAGHRWGIRAAPAGRARQLRDY